MEDTENKQIIYSPYNLLSISNYYINNNTLAIEAKIQKDLEDNNNNFDISNEAVDANGNNLEIIASGVGSSTNESFLNYELKLKDNYKGPITFKISDYPSKIKGEFKVKIPLDY